MLRIVLMCWTKFNCLFDVVTQKSSRTISNVSRDSLPSSPTTLTDDFVPNGGFARQTDQRLPGSAVNASRTSIGLSPVGEPIPWRTCSSRRAVPSTSSTPCTKLSAILSASESDRQRVGLHARMRRARTPVPRRGQRQCRQWWAAHSRPLLDQWAGRDTGPHLTSHRCPLATGLRRRHRYRRDTR